MQTIRPESASDDDDDKLIPEWEVEADDQIIWVGLAVLAAVVLATLGWNWLQGDEGPTEAAVGVPTEERSGRGSVDEIVDVATTAIPATTATTQATTTSTTEAASTTQATTTAPSGPDLDGLTGALTPLPGELTAVVVGSTVTLTGYVADSAEEEAAIEAASAVDGVDAVTSDLVLLEPAVAQVLSDERVVIATVDGVGTDITVSGTLQAEADRAPTIAAAEAVPGVTSIIDRLEVSVADALNELPTIPFATGSATILPDGQAIVAEAAALIGDAGEASFEVQGYTDIVGDDRANLELSQARATAVVDALVAAGIDPDVMTARGFGETEQFATGNSADALAANRVVRFLQTG